MTPRLLLASLALVAVCSPGLRAQDRRPPATHTDILAAEAARAAEAGQLDLLRTAARDGPARLRQIAVRAIGRLERPDLVPDLLPLLSVAPASIRAEAADALAQAARSDRAVSATVRRALAERLAAEPDTQVRAAICEAIGRLPARDAKDVGDAERVLTDETGRPGSRVGALRGLESLIRLSGRISPPSQRAIARLRRLAATSGVAGRRLAILALNGASAADAATIDRALADTDVEVRRLAVSAAGATIDHVRRGIGDRSAMVRYEALRAYGRRFQPAHGCSPILAATGDADPHVALLAIDLLGNPGRPGEPAAETLVAAAAALDSRATGPQPAAAPARAGWHRPAHALVALARSSPELAAQVLPAFLAAEPWQARMYAARAAALTGDGKALTALAEDAHANVREAAVAGLAKTVKHGADGIYLREIGSDDAQLVMAAAGALAGTPGRQEAVRRLLAALQRWTAGGSDTSRDPRLAILERLQELGSASDAASIEPLIRDFDPPVAARASEVIARLTGAERAPQPIVRPIDPPPDEPELRRLSRAIVRLEMAGGGRVEIRLMTDLAPLSCARFAGLVESGYYDGLTFHRVAPNFVIQGGSPGANEYAGHSRFMRDEPGRATQARGTVGTSTRGRDSGDAQFYVNLVDNVRLDHDYTIFGEVTRGMEVVDRVLEGAVIERAVLVAGAR